MWPHIPNPELPPVKAMLNNTSFTIQVITVHWLAFLGQPQDGAAGIVDIPFWTTGTSHVHIKFRSVCDLDL